MRTITVNGKLYKAKAFDFNTVCDMEDMGISMEMMREKPMSMVRAYFGLCAGAGKEYAGRELEKHFANGGKMIELMQVMGEEMQESDFFRSIMPDKEQETTETQDETAEENPTAAKRTAKKQQ